MTINLSDDPKFQVISENLEIIRNEIGEAAIVSGRKPEDVRLMAVTKTVDVKYINHAIENCGVDLIGENKVQEFLSKKDALSLSGVEKHLIGHLQTNKVKKIVSEVDMIQSVDSLRLASAVSAECVKQGIETQVLLELNIGQEDSKTGFDKTEFFESLEAIAELPAIKVKGLMTIPPISDDILELEKYFSKMFEYYNVCFCGFICNNKTILKFNTLTQKFGIRASANTNKYAI